MSVRSFARSFNFSERHVWRQIANGTLPVIRLGKSVRVPVDAVRALLEGRLTNTGGSAR